MCAKYISNQPHSVHLFVFANYIKKIDIFSFAYKTVLFLLSA